ncbi:hypothetical protein FY034_02780 [Trichlorobacter lovleyi]|uniref:hypothetical protein n=1 Tax=Trichlorobacter lovleyi TaxID=313985 RepID=UPI00223EB4F1|nr:hypothetical protein [Trichlorobacter lovleyi]QOX77910.1 hypothetical protein FY034_02780 [Trichlorobacter lovleyi]
MPRVINLRNIPDDLFRRFKAECALNDADMTTILIRCMNLFIQTGDWHVAKNDTDKYYNNLFIAVEQEYTDSAGFYIKKQ